MIRFSKYHGCGNNFIIMRESELPGDVRGGDYSRLAVRVCDINTGIGADGMIIVREEPELEMVFFNRDGSRAPMCGNGIRCFANFCGDEGIRSEDSYTVKTLAGDMVVDVTCRDPFSVRINMGKPVFAPHSIGVDSQSEDYLDRRLTLSDGTEVTIDSLFMGTVHTVVYTDDLSDEAVNRIGAEICGHPVFAEKTNVNFVKVIDDKTMAVKTYERGVGMTLACGTGACASVVAAGIRGLCGKKAEVVLALGSLNIEIAEDGSVFMEGPSVRICGGTLCGGEIQEA